MNAGAEKQSLPRLIGVGLFIGLPALFAALAVLNFVQLGDDQFATAEKQNQLAALTRRLNSTKADAKPQDLSTIYFAGASRSLASASLQQYIVDTVSATSGRLIETVSVDPDTADNPDDADSIRLKTALDIDNHGLLQLLYKLESGLPLVDIETLSIRRLPNEGDETKAETLRIDMGVRGKWRPQNA
jgi:hypothetical protein